jgi:hypothetical protein
MFVSFQVEVSATSWSPVQRSPTDCGAPMQLRWTFFSGIHVHLNVDKLWGSLGGEMHSGLWYHVVWYVYADYAMLQPRRPQCGT